MHEQTRARIDLDNRAAHFLQRPADVLGDHVDAGDVQVDDARGESGHVGDLGVHLVGAVEGHVAVALHQHLATGFGHRIRPQSLALQQQAHGRLALQADGLQRKLLGLTAAGIAVELAVDQGTHRGNAVAGDPQAFATTGGHHLAAHDQHPVLVATDVALDHHVAALSLGNAESTLDVGLIGQFQRDTTTVVRVGRLDHDGQSDVLRRLPGFGGAVDHLPLRHGYTARLQQRLGQVLVAGDVFGNRAGQVRLGGPDAALTGTLAQLNQVAVVQALKRYAPLGGGIDDGRGRGAQPRGVDHFPQLHHGLPDIEGLVVDRGFQQGMTVAQRRLGRFLVASPEHHAVDAMLRGAARLAEARGHAGAVEQLDDAVLQHMAGPGPLPQALQETAMLANAAVMGLQPWQHREQAIGQALNGVGRALFQLTQIQPDFHGRAVGPDIGAPQETVPQDGQGESV